MMTGVFGLCKMFDEWNLCLQFNCIFVFVYVYKMLMYNSRVNKEELKFCLLVVEKSLSAE